MEAATWYASRKQWYAYRGEWSKAALALRRTPVILPGDAHEKPERMERENPEFSYGEIYSLDDALENGKNIFGDFLNWQHRLSQLTYIIISISVS